MIKKVYNQGTVLFMVLVFCIILTILGYVYIAIAERDTMLALRVQRERIAFFMAESGLNRVRAWIKEVDPSPEAWNYRNQNPPWTNRVTPFDPLGGANSVLGHPGTYTVQVDPDDWNLPGTWTRTYFTSSTGTYQTASIALREIVIREDYTRFCYFSNNENFPPWASARWQTFNDIYVWGCVHSNSAINVMGFPNWTPANVTSAVGFNLLTGGVMDSNPGNIVEPIDMYETWARDFTNLYDRANLRLIGNHDFELWSDPVAPIRFGPGNGLYNNMTGGFRAEQFRIGGAVIHVQGNIHIRDKMNNEGFTGCVTIVATGDIVIDSNITLLTYASGSITLVAGNNIIVNMCNCETNPPLNPHHVLGSAFDHGDFTVSLPYLPAIDGVRINAFLMCRGSFAAVQLGSPLVPPLEISVFGGIIQGGRGSLNFRPLAYGADNATGFKLGVGWDRRILDEAPPWLPRHVEVKATTWRQR